MDVAMINAVNDYLLLSKISLDKSYFNECTKNKNKFEKMH